jgi:hypothetical protein
MLASIVRVWFCLIMSCMTVQQPVTPEAFEAGYVAKSTPRSTMSGV